MRKLFLSLVISLTSLFAISGQESPDVTQGSLFATTRSGDKIHACPLVSTKVRADISGFIARVSVTQEFENKFTEPIEAIYTFPLSQNAAVDEMTMKIGERTILGKILKKEEARQVYKKAKEEGKTAGLLDQDRPNIFTQAVANIMPGEKIIITISYAETLTFDDGSYEFVFPMTITPRYEPSSTEKVPEPPQPPISATRPSHDISIDVNLNGGVPLEDIRSNTHKITTINSNSHSAKITLQGEKTIPNRDFVLRYDVIGKKMEDAVLATGGAKGGFFSLMLSPPERMTTEDRTPKEIVFVLDTSGSMSGFPIEKAKEAMKLSLDGLYPEDTFNLITFAGDTAILFDDPVPATRANLDKAQAFLDARTGGGGTEMMKAIKAALDPSDAKGHLRIVCFMTDGAVGNDMEIIAEVKKHPNARIFAFGIGDSVNRFLLDNIAKEGRGEVEYVMLDDDGSRAAARFHERIRNPYLTDISIDWGGLPVTDVYPKRLPDLFGAKPVVIHGRYSGAASGKIKLRGNIGGQPFQREIAVDLPANNPNNAVLSSLWARSKVDELMSKSWNVSTDEASPTAAIKNQVTKLALEHNLMTQYTSFVAVEERVVTQIRNGKRVRVSGYAPAGTAFENQGDGIGYGNGSGMGFGSGGSSGMSNMPASVTNVTLTVSKLASAPSPPAQTVSGGVMNGRAVSLPKPHMPTTAMAVNARGSVSVQVTVDENGKVISASAVSGHPMLRIAAEQAARASAFQPTMLSGQPVKFSGVIVYNFGNAATPAPESKEAVLETVAVPIDEALISRQKLLAERLHAWLYDLVERVKAGTAPSPNETKFVTGGKAEIRVELTAIDPAMVEKLKSAGFEIVSEKGASVTGRIPIEKLAGLAEIEEVKLILPKI